ncbi:MAG: hypothetical protein A2020_12560 [Lentisphaerae bacterium GWF2_45_14]|nr:MAG: hypothetical protein A2020_12560 [Lentisphaerae bacterium GWF2_45_14]
MLFERFEKEFPIQMACLKNARKNGRLSHAYILHSDDPELRRDFPTVAAQIAICPFPTEDGSPCGECKGCRSLENGTYPEFFTLEPASKSRIIPVGETSNPEEDTLRWFEGLFYLTSATSEGKKVGVIYDADRMQPAAQNAFLKTLEEPPSSTFFILTTGHPSELLPTTLSRCQMISLISNRCSYSFPWSETLFKTLKALQFDSEESLAKGEDCALAIIEIFSALGDEASDAVAAKWEKRLEHAKDELEAAGRKRIEKRMDAEGGAEYLKRRTCFLSALHCWFSQIYQLSCGAAPEELSNPELFAGLELPQKIDEERALNDLAAAEKFLYDLNFYVDESLAVRSFCLNIVLGNQVTLPARI